MDFSSFNYFSNMLCAVKVLGLIYTGSAFHQIPNHIGCNFEFHNFSCKVHFVWGCTFSSCFWVYITSFFYLNFTFKPGTRPQPACLRLWARAWFPGIVLQEVCACNVCMHSLFDFPQPREQTFYLKNQSSSIQTIYYITLTHRLALPRKWVSFNRKPGVVTIHRLGGWLF